MSHLEIEERFAVAADPDRVFRFFLEPEALVGCMPGAELDEIESDRVFKGKVRVKVGTVTIGYAGRVELTRVDEDARCLEARGEGREKGGAGKVGVDLTVRVEPDGAGAAKVEVVARVKLAGRIVRFGRGLVDAVSKELFQDFARSVAERVEASTPTAGDTPLSTSAASSAHTGAPIRALPLLWRSLRSWLRRLLGWPD